MVPETQELGTAEDLVERVAAIDVAKASGMVCMRLPHETRTGRRVQEVWNVPSTTSAILELGDRLVCQGVTRVVMEATGAYWKPYFFLLEARGLECWLVNARDVKNVPGRPKTDKLDAVWLAKLTERGMLRPSFVPPKPVRQLRDLTRLRAILNQERSRHKQRVEKILEDAQIKVTSVLTDLFGASGRDMLAALIAGERRPRVLADLARGNLVRKKVALADALTGQFEDHHSYTPTELRRIVHQFQRTGATAILTTEKDSVNLCEGCDDLTAPLPVYWLKARMVIDGEDELLREIEKRIK